MDVGSISIVSGWLPVFAFWVAVAVGAQNSESLQPIQTLQGLASKTGIDTCIAPPPDGHDFGLWKQAFSDSLPWLPRKLKLTPQPPSVPAHSVPGTS